jgi:phosphatidylserine/phosphatidylglycerophosphate/cardiolipin synthase-like enzyme
MPSTSTVDGMIGIIGSSNTDYRSFGLDYEIALMSPAGKEFVADLPTNTDRSAAN